MKSEETLDQLLETSSVVDSPSADVLVATRKVVAAEAEATAARAAKIVHLRRRHRRLTIGVAAAAVAGLVAIPLLSRGSASTPLSAAPPVTHVAPPVQAHYRTVAQVINAAAAHTGSADPTAEAYWKVHSTYVGWGCELGGVPIGAPPSTKPTPTICHTFKGTRTAWTATAGGTGVLEDTDSPGQRPSLGPGTIVVDGQNFTWRQFNAKSWTDAQLETLINYGGTADVPGYSTRSWYSLKDAFDLLAESPISPAIRAQLWKIVEKIPGVQLVGQATDHAGRTGWEISFSDPADGTMTFIIDTTTGMLLESGGSVKASNGAKTYETYLSAEPTTTAPSVLEYHGGPPTKAECKRLVQSGPKLTQCLRSAKG